MKNIIVHKFTIPAFVFALVLTLGASSGLTSSWDTENWQAPQAEEDLDGKISKDPDSSSSNRETVQPTGTDGSSYSERFEEMLEKEKQRKAEEAKHDSTKTAQEQKNEQKDAEEQKNKVVKAIEDIAKAATTDEDDYKDLRNYLGNKVVDIALRFEDFKDHKCPDGSTVNAVSTLKKAFQKSFLENANRLKKEAAVAYKAGGQDAFEQYIYTELTKIYTSDEVVTATLDKECAGGQGAQTVASNDQYSSTGGYNNSGAAMEAHGQGDGPYSSIPSGGNTGSGNLASPGSSSSGNPSSTAAPMSYPTPQNSDPSGMSYGPDRRYLKIRRPTKTRKRTVKGGAYACTYYSNKTYSKECLDKFNELTGQDWWSYDPPHGIAYKTYDAVNIVCLDVGSTACKEEGNGQIVVTSGYRSVQGNKNLYASMGKSPTNSEHSRATALDLVYSDYRNVRKIHSACVARKMGGCGLYTGSKFNHIDTGKVRQW